MSNTKITHKELLTFTNLTNLEWQFVNLEAIRNGEHSYVAGTEETDEDISTQLNDLLRPDVFARTNEEGEIEEYEYMKDVETREEITEEDLKKGRMKLRKEAGMAMEYLEKRQEEGNEEGKFLENWEVIYAADNYKTVADYLNQKWLKLINACEKQADVEHPLPTKTSNPYERMRKKIENGEDTPYFPRDQIEEWQDSITAEERRKDMINFAINLGSDFLVISSGLAGDFKLKLSLSNLPQFSLEGVKWAGKGILRKKEIN